MGRGKTLFGVEEKLGLRGKTAPAGERCQKEALQHSKFLSYIYISLGASCSEAPSLPAGKRILFGSV